MRFRLFASALMSFTALAVAGCGGSGVALQPQPPASGPSTFTLQAGTSSQQEALQGLNFYPAALTVDVGDTVTWKFPAGEPHTVSIVPAGQSIPAPNSPSAAAPAGGNTTDGSTYTSSGFVLLGGKYSLAFTKPGTYVYHCIIHPGMVGTIVVNPAGTRYPQTQQQYDALAASSENTDLTNAAASIATFPYAAGASHVAVGISPPVQNGRPSSSTVLRYLTGPSLASGTLTIAVGTTVTWTNLSNNEPHTVTLAPNGQAFPTIPPPGTPTNNTTFDGTTFSNSGNIFPGASYSLTFTAAGTYVVHCVYHDETENMIQTVIVQ